MPKISVIMPVFNCEKYIKESIASVLEQSFQDFEFIIVDDCSTDSTLEIVKSFQDKRIKILKNTINLGVAKSLNKAIAHAKGIYIARMDGDDVCCKHRLKKQVSFLEKNPKIAMVGTSMFMIDASGKIKMIKKYPENTEKIRIWMLFENAFSHPTCMIRKEVFEKGEFLYNPNAKSEDYDLWSKICFQFEVANLNDKLLYYRIYEGNTTILKEKSMEKDALEIQRKMWKLVGIEYPFEKTIFKSIVNYESLVEIEKFLKNAVPFLNLNKNSIQSFRKKVFSIYYLYNMLENKKINVNKRYWKEFGYLYKENKEILELVYEIQYQSKELIKRLINIRT